jgi:hypothetical protein
MSAQMRYHVELKDGSTRRSCWVDKRVNVGDRITLKDSDEPERLWTVTHACGSQMLSRDITRGWHVGGL